MVGRCKPATEIRQQVDLSAVVHPWSENAWHLDTDVDLGVVPDHGRVDDEDQQRDLVGGIVLLEKGGCVVVTDRRVSWALSKYCTDQGKKWEVFEMHCEREMLGSGAGM